MRLDGIHHVTCITGDAPRNVDFYTRVLGLRLVKKTVNQDDPTVYHLFYADERGSPGADLTFFEYPGAASGQAGAGMVHRIVWRVAVGGRARFLGGAPRRRGHRVRPRARPPAVRRSRRPRPRARRGRVERRAAGRRPSGGPAEHALQGFDGVRAYAPIRTRAAASRGAARFEPTDGRWEIRGDGEARGTPTTRAARGGRGGAGTGTTSPGSPRWTTTRPGASGASAGEPDADHRPVLFPLDLLPRAERRPVRDRHAGARVHDRRAARAPRRVARRSRLRSSTCGSASSPCSRRFPKPRERVPRR